MIEFEKEQRLKHEKEMQALRKKHDIEIKNLKIQERNDTAIRKMLEWQDELNERERKAEETLKQQ